MAQYQKPPAILTRVGNPVTMFLVKRFGMRRTGVQVLTVKGRTSGEPRQVPVNPLDFESARYLVCPRGESEWVRNLRAAGGGSLEVGGTSTTFTAEEVADGDKVPILREYLRRWERAAGSYFGVGKDATDAQLTKIAPRHPVFCLR